MFGGDSVTCINKISQIDSTLGIDDSVTVLIFLITNTPYL